MFCDWLVVSQVLPVNPASAVRGPKHVVTKGSKHVVTKGSTPVLSPAEARKLLHTIDTGTDTGTLAGLRDRAGPSPTRFTVFADGSRALLRLLGLRPFAFSLTDVCI